MKLPLLLRALALLFLLPLASPAHGQYSGSGSTMTMYYANGPATTMHASSGSTGFEVPVERTGHSFTFNWKTTSNGAVNSTTAYPMGFVTSSPVTGTNADVLNAAIRSLLVTAYTPPTYTYTSYT